MINSFSPLINQIKKNEQTNKISFFYVNYKDDFGMHIRLRIKGITEIELKNALKQFGLLNYKNEKYFPETERYGGESNIHYAELFFEANSNILLEIFSENPTWNYNNSLMFSIVFQEIILEINKINVYDFSEKYFGVWIEFSLAISSEKNVESTINYFEKKYNLLKDKLIANLNQMRPRISDLSLKYNHLIFYKKIQNWSIKNKTDFLQGLIHMNNNRLGIKNHDESFLSFLLMKIHENK